MEGEYGARDVRREKGECEKREAEKRKGNDTIWEYNKSKIEFVVVVFVAFIVLVRFVFLQCSVNPFENFYIRL